MDSDGFAHHAYYFDPSWSLGHVVAGTISMLFWLALMGFLIWSVYQLANRQAPRVQQPARPAGPSAMELLRQRYVMGDIDATTFEEMVERVMASEAWERQEEVRRLVRPRPPEPRVSTARRVPPLSPEPPTSPTPTAET